MNQVASLLNLNREVFIADYVSKYERDNGTLSIAFDTSNGSILTTVTHELAMAALTNVIEPLMLGLMINEGIIKQDAYETLNEIYEASPDSMHKEVTASLEDMLRKGYDHQGVIH
ncbi:MAG: hypothetical protein AAGJ90_19755 [Pseudomonadota bacterium]